MIEQKHLTAWMLDVAETVTKAPEDSVSLPVSSLDLSTASSATSASFDTSLLK